MLVLLALAGLLRPEAWLLSAAYLAWLARDRRPRALAPLAALAALGPLLWALSDLAVTGDALWSLHHTRTGTELLERPTGAAEAVEQLPRHLNFLLGTPVLVVGLLGFVAGLVAARRRMWGLVAVIVLLGGAFLVLALAGLSLQPRYLAGLAAAIVICAGIGGLGWLVLGREDVWRGRWRVAGAAGLVLLVAGLPFDAADHRTPATAWSTTGACSRSSRAATRAPRCAAASRSPSRRSARSRTSRCGPAPSPARSSRPGPRRPRRARS